MRANSHELGVENEAQLELSNACFSPKRRKSGTAADGVLSPRWTRSASPGVAWDLQARVALAESDLMVRGNRFSSPRAG